MSILRCIWNVEETEEALGIFLYILAKQQSQNDRQREKWDECMKGGRGIFQLGDSEKSTL